MQDGNLGFVYLLTEEHSASGNLLDNYCWSYFIRPLDVEAAGVMRPLDLEASG